MNRAPSDKVVEVEVPGELAGERADRVAALLFAEHSRTLLSRWLKSGALLVDGETVKPNRKLDGGQRLTLTPEPTPDEDWATPQPVDFNVVYEDDQLLVIDKPAGLVAHPGTGNPDGTLVNGLLHRRAGQIELPRAGLVHRLDQDTSGLLVVAATRQAQRRLAEAVAQHRIARRYLGVVEGVMTGGQTIDKPIGRDPHHRTRQRVRGDGRPARTRIGVRQRFRAHTYLSAELETGRTHQIRVHLASIGHPLVGDRRYGARGRLPRAPHPEVMLTVRGFQRQALHASELAFEHPATGERCEFRSPLPRDMAELVAVLTLDAEARADER